MTPFMHKHHIVPRHMGGSNHASNLVLCTVAEHAEFHRVLMETHGSEWDRIAWLSLSGQISVPEAKRKVQQEARRRGGDAARLNRNANGTSIGDWNRKTGHVLTIATAAGMVSGGAKVGRMLVDSGRFEAVRKLGSVAGGKSAMPKLNSSRWRCVECGMVSHSGGIGNHQRGSKHQGKEEVCL